MGEEIALFYIFQRQLNKGDRIIFLVELYMFNKVEYECDIIECP